jgi:hypothetical protein
MTAKESVLIHRAQRITCIQTHQDGALRVFVLFAGLYQMLAWRGLKFMIRCLAPWRTQPKPETPPPAFSRLGRVLSSSGKMATEPFWFQMLFDLRKQEKRTARRIGALSNIPRKSFLLEGFRIFLKI